MRGMTWDGMEVGVVVDRDVGGLSAASSSLTMSVMEGGRVDITSAVAQKKLKTSSGFSNQKCLHLHCRPGHQSPTLRGSAHIHTYTYTLGIPPTATQRLLTTLLLLFDFTLCRTGWWFPRPLRP